MEEETSQTRSPTLIVALNPFSVLSCQSGICLQVTCETWKDGQWVITHELMRVRFEHSAYNSPDGLILMGSSDYPGNIKTVMLEKDAVVGDFHPHGTADV